MFSISSRPPFHHLLIVFQYTRIVFHDPLVVFPLLLMYNGVNPTKKNVWIHMNRKKGHGKVRERGQREERKYSQCKEVKGGIGGKM